MELEFEKHVVAFDQGVSCPTQRFSELLDSWDSETVRKRYVSSSKMQISEAVRTHLRGKSRFRGDC